MTATPTLEPLGAPPLGTEAHRIFLVVVDDSKELPEAIGYACARA